MLSSSFKSQSLNPATLLALWILAILLAMYLSSRYGVSVALVAGIVANTCARAQFHQLLRRSRWLLLSVAIIFLCMTPGVPLFSIAGIQLPSADGLHAAIDQIGRLILALAMLALLLGQLDQNELIAGLRQLLSMLHLPGFDPDRAALRLCLTLRRIAQGSQVAVPQRWQSRFNIPAVYKETNESIVVQVYPFRTVDKVSIAIAVITCIAIVMLVQTLPSARFVP